jgi:chromosome partitioning protein
MTSTAAVPTDVYELLAVLAKQVGDPDYRVDLVWSHSGPALVVLIYSEKGGVGKTAMTTGLAAVAAANGLRVVVIDLDPRATATAELGVSDPAYSVNDILYMDPTEDDPPNIRGTGAEFFVPAGPDWPGAVQVLAAERRLGNREFDNTDGMTDRLALALDGDALADVDLVLVDVPPRAGGKLPAVAARLRQGRALIPMLLDPDGWIGATDALTTLRRSRASAGLEPMPIVGVVRHIVDRRRTQLAAMYDQKVRTEAPLVDHLLGDVAVPKYGIRVEAREMMVPITAATTPEARAVIASYTHILNHVAKAG